MLDKLQYGLTANFDLKEVLLSFVFSALLAGLTTVWFLYGSPRQPGMRKLARSFLPLALGMALLSTVLSSSVALALGLVGAMSVVRFRSRVDSLDGLQYLFLSLAIGLGAGTGQRLIVGLGVVLILGLLAFRDWGRREWEYTSTLTLDCPTGHFEEIQNLLKSLPGFSLMEFSSRPGSERWVLVCELPNLAFLEKFKAELARIHPASSLSLRHEDV